MDINHTHGPVAAMRPPENLDYSLTGNNAHRAVEMGLAEADWYQTPVPRATMRKLLERSDGPAIRDSILWFVLLALTGGATAILWGSWWAVIPYLAFAVLYGTASDSRWHECGHGTAFRTDWMNSVVYEIASFMVMRESVVWRWSHARHHSDTIVVGRDPEIQVPRPPDMLGLVLSLFAVGGYRTYFPRLIMHAAGRVSAEERVFIPESEFPRVYRNARICLAIYLAVVVVAIMTRSWLPVFLFVLPQFFGTWLMIIQNTPQHAGLAENVLDHRLNCRTVYMNPISRFIYWNMNYHVEHHMFPLVPYHALSKLHEVIKDDCPPPYPSILSAWREILPTLLRQVKDPAYHVKRRLPEPMPRQQEGPRRSEANPDAGGWLEVCAAADLETEDVIRFDHGRKTFALCRDVTGALYATDGICTHGNTHLSEGLVKGGIIECPKHNGRFNLKDGSPARVPICRGLATWPIEERGGRIWLNVTKAGGDGTRSSRTVTLRVVSSRNVSTFIRELVFEPAGPSDTVDFEPGDYLQFDIPPYERIRFRDFDIPEPYAAVWERQHVFALEAVHGEEGRRNNYSIAGRNGTADRIVINVRIATPPPGQDCPPGVGSSFMFQLKPGDAVTAIGPFGDFHIKPTRKEMIYIGGGAGMAPLRAHLDQLLESDKSERRISYWYGARSRQEIYYADYFERLAAEHENFNFHIALSDPVDGDEWAGPVGFIHDVVREEYLDSHPNPTTIEYYLCGPPMMVKACNKMLNKLGVDPSQIAYDEF